MTDIHKRLRLRLPVHTKVEIQFPGSEFITCWSRDMSIKGMFVDTEDMLLPHHALIRVRLCQRIGKQARYAVMLAVVVRRTKQGIGLMYVHGVTKARKAIHAMMYGSRLQSVMSPDPE